MSERISRFFVLLEAWVILVPTTALALYGSVFLLGAGIGDGIGRIHPVPALLSLLSIVALGAGWVLVFRFLVRGHAALVASSRWVWALAVGGALVAGGALAVLLFDSGQPARVNDGGFRLLAFGAPAIVPLAHLICERAREVAV
jgi:hypothetical protein